LVIQRGSLQGVLLPTVGNFFIGPSKPKLGFTVPNRVVPTFLLHEGRFAAVSQEAPKVSRKIFCSPSASWNATVIRQEWEILVLRFVAIVFWT
jgi:hypothetical protein